VARRTRSRVGTRLQVIAASVVAIVVVGGAAVAQGFDVKKTPETTETVWAIQSGLGQRYAQVNTRLNELVTVKSLSHPSMVVQTPNTVEMLAQDNRKYLPLNLSLPTDVADDSPALKSAPSGTVSVSSFGSTVAYLTSSGGVFVQDLSAGSSEPRQIDPTSTAGSGDKKATFVANAVAAGTHNDVYMYSSSDAKVRHYKLVDGSFDGDGEQVSGAPQGDKVSTSLTVVGDRWVLYDENAKKIWVSGHDASLGLDGVDAEAVLERPSDVGDAVYLAGPTGLWSLKADGTEQVRKVTPDAQVSGKPAAPASAAGVVYAAWLPQGSASGALWSSAAGRVSALDYAGGSLTAEPTPVFQANGEAIVLNDTKSGWIWNAATAQLVHSSQRWDLTSAATSQTTQQAEVTKVTDPKAPIAEPDSFGVRAGRLSVLPVLLNDHDPNEDVLSIDTSAPLTLEPASFGSIALTSHDSEVAVRVSDAASGGASFSYRAVDGTASNGLTSAPATVHLSVIPDSQNTAPTCDPEHCEKKWPTPEISPGGSVSVPVLAGWVDAEGDEFFVDSVENPSGVGTATSTPDGRVVYQHPNPGQTEASTVTLRVTISDVLGAKTTKDLAIKVTPAPVLHVEPFVATTAVNELLSVSMSEHSWGGARSATVTNVTLPADEAHAEVHAISNSPTFTFMASAAGSYIATVVMTDGKSEKAATVRFIVSDPGASHISSPPVTVFVASGLDATADVLAAVSNPSGRVLMVSDAVARPVAGASLMPDIVGQNLLRVEGATATNAPGLLGTVDYVVSDGSGDPAFQTTGQAIVYMVAGVASTPPIALNDEATVRVGTTTDIPVLANDVAPLAATLVLDPVSIDEKCTQSLAFAAGSILRVLAPEVAGDYRCQYRTYVAGAPTQSSTATVTIHVQSAGGNRPPVAATLNGRVIAGEKVVLPIDSATVDPDGDPVSVYRVSAVDSKMGSVSITPDGQGIEFQSYAGKDVPTGTARFEYTLRDAQGATAVGVGHVGILSKDKTEPKPVTYTDYVQVQAGQGNQVVVNPLLNDIDPTGGVLSLTDEGVIPDAKPDSTSYKRLAALISPKNGNSVTIAAGNDPGTNSFRYTAQSTNGSQAIGRIVVKVVSGEVANFPVVSDTVVTMADRGKLAQGIDVVTGKVAWNGGSISDLKLELTGASASGFAADGWKISGTAPNEGRVVAFSLSGPSGTAGVTVKTYGFLRIPAKQSVVLARDPQLATPQVDEDQSVQFDAAAFIPVPDGERLELVQASASGQRANGQCSVTGSTQIGYTAGTGGPWVDSCLLTVRLAGGTETSVVAIPVKVIAKEKIPDLKPATIALTPGKNQQKTLDLATLTTWDEHSASDIAGLSFVVDTAAANGKYRVSQSGSVLTLEAESTLGVSSSENTNADLTVTLSKFPDVRTIVHLVYMAPSIVKPEVKDISKTCDIDAPTCVATLEETQNDTTEPLKITNFTEKNCNNADVKIGDLGQNISITNLPANTSKSTGECSGRFTASDVRNRINVFSFSMTLTGYPDTPNDQCVKQTGFGHSSVKLDIDIHCGSLVYSWTNPKTTASTLTAGTLSVPLPTSPTTSLYIWSQDASDPAKESVHALTFTLQTPSIPTIFSHEFDLDSAQSESNSSQGSLTCTPSSVEAQTEYSFDGKTWQTLASPPGKVSHEPAKGVALYCRAKLVLTGMDWLDLDEASFVNVGPVEFIAAPVLKWPKSCTGRDSDSCAPTHTDGGATSDRVTLWYISDPSDAATCGSPLSTSQYTFSFDNGEHAVLACLTNGYGTAAAKYTFAPTNSSSPPPSTESPSPQPTTSSTGSQGTSQ
jgi:hypothetical protein